MEEFKAHLVQTAITRAMYATRMINLLKNYLEWLKNNHLQIETSQYKDLMNFIGHLQNEGKSKFHINRTLQTISHYYRFKSLPDLARTTRQRGITRTQPQHLLGGDELEKIYHAFAAKQDKGYYYHTDKIILGMILYQGLDMQEFQRIALKDVNLEKGQIYIGESSHKRSRQIPLKANQVLALHTFIHQIRPQLIKTASEKLFTPQAEDYSLLHWQFKQLSKKVKQQIKEKLDIDIHKLSQLRQSRIALWTKEEGLRKAQYLAGFRRVSSAERYRQANLEDLKQQIKLHHPLQ